MAKILIVEDDVELATKVRDVLAAETHTVDMTHNGEDALQLLESYQYEAIILDWQLPDISGVDVCRRFRSRGGCTPIIFLTGKGGLENKEQGLDSGADDYLTKPFHVKELLARLRALLRRPSGMQPQTLTCGWLTLETGTHRVFARGNELKLLPKELALLEFLMRRPNQFFTAKALLDAVWSSESEASEDTIRTYIKTLRKKISTDGEESLIKNVHGLGYKIQTPD